MQHYEMRRPPAFLKRSELGGVFAALAWLAAPAPAAAQDIGPVSFRDSLVMRQVAYRAPCPRPAPKSWIFVDSTLGSGLRCSLVEWAVRALEAQLEQRPALRTRADPRNPLCVRVIVAQNTGSTGLPGDWLVVFDLGLHLPAHVMIDRQTGGIVTAIVGRTETAVEVPACLAKSGEQGTGR